MKNEKHFNSLILDLRIARDSNKISEEEAIWLNYVELIKQHRPDADPELMVNLVVSEFDWRGTDEQVIEFIKTQLVPELEYTLEVITQVKVTINQLCNILATAFEGGINYWCNGVKADRKYFTFISDAWKDDPKTVYSLDVLDDDPATVTVGDMLNAIKRYIQEGRLDHGMEIDEVDADGADLILQYAALGEITYA